MIKVGAQRPRNYLGASGLGEKCDAKLWFEYKYPKVIEDPRVHRIFHLGHSLEETLINYMRDAGLKIHTHKLNGEQFGFVDGIIAGHVDAFLETEEENFLIEFKTYNTKRFETLKKNGVRESDPKYYTQVCIYMGEFKVDRCLLIAIDKNDCELHIELVEYDPFEHRWAIERGKLIGIMNERPIRKYDHVSNFNCKLCNYRKECWN